MGTIWSCLTEDGLILASVDHTDDVHDEDGLGILNNALACNTFFPNSNLSYTAVSMVKLLTLWTHNVLGKLTINL